MFSGVNKKSLPFLLRLSTRGCPPLCPRPAAGLLGAQGCKEPIAGKSARRSWFQAHSLRPNSTTGLICGNKSRKMASSVGVDVFCTLAVLWLPCPEFPSLRGNRRISVCVLHVCARGPSVFSRLSAQALSECVEIGGGGIRVTGRGAGGGRGRGSY